VATAESSDAGAVEFTLRLVRSAERLVCDFDSPACEAKDGCGNEAVGKNHVCRADCIDRSDSEQARVARTSAYQQHSRPGAGCCRGERRQRFWGVFDDRRVGVTESDAFHTTTTSILHLDCTTLLVAREWAVCLLLLR